MAYCCLGLIGWMIVIGFLGFIYVKIRKFLKVPPVPRLGDVWWGPGREGKDDEAIVPFNINISDEIVRDFKQRLENALPFHEPIEGAGQSYGMNSNTLKNVVDFWKTKYDWREREKYLNQYPQFQTSIQGLKIHFLHVKPTNTEGLKVYPLLIVHGWPGSVREFYDIIPLLTTRQPNRDYVFEVIAPSLPGYWFSDATTKKGLGPASMAVIFKNLMKRLGFTKYYVQGGDWGAIIVDDLAVQFPASVIGILSNMPMSTRPCSIIKLGISRIIPSLILTEEELRHKDTFSIKKIAIFRGEEGGYFQLQSTKPDTIGAGLRDSPVGLCAYILEKYITWTNPDYLNLVNGEIQNKENLTSVLDIITTYWMTRTITSSVRIYYEYSKADKKFKLQKIPIEVPSGVARYAYDVFCMPEKVLKDKFQNMVYSSFHQKGHFAALEVPEVLAEDIFKFVDKVDRSKNM